MNNSIKKQLKIGIIVDQLLAGGVQLAAIEQVKELQKLGHIVKLVILMRKKYATDFSYLVTGIPYEYLSDRYPPLAQRSFKFPFFSFFSTLHILSLFFAPYIIKKDEYDILVSWGTTTSLTTNAIYRSTLIPYIAVIHDPIEYILEKVYRATVLKYLFFLLKPLAIYFEGSFVKDAVRTLIISKVHEKYIVDKYGVRPELLYFGTQPLAKLPFYRGNKILSFGRWQPEKHPEFLLELACKIPQAQFVIAGSWLRQDALHKFKILVSDYKLGNRVKVLSHFSQSELDRLCKDARMFIHPHFEAFGLAALEAAAHGLPIIIPKHSGVTEYFLEGQHGFFPDQIQLENFIKPIELLLNDKQRAYNMGKLAWEVVKKEFSWSANTQKLLNIINSTLKEYAKPEIVVLETGHALGIQLSGGDKLMEPMTRRLTPAYKLTVIVPKVGARHWQQNPGKKRLILLPLNPFDNQGAPIPVFLTYCIRVWDTLRILLSLPSKNSIMYSSTNLLPDVLPAFLISKLKGYKWIARVHHLIPLPHKRKGIWIVNVVAYLMQVLSLTMIKKRADLVVVLNVKLKIQLMRKNFLSEKLAILGAGIDFKTIANIPIDMRFPVYQGIYVGRIHPSKGVFDLVPIWKKVIAKHKNAKLAVIGTGDSFYRKQLAENVQNENLRNSIVLFGHVSTNYLYRILKRAKVFLFTDHEAGWGIAVAEAMAAKLPVVGYDIGIMGTVYKHGYKIVPLGNTQRMAHEISNLLSNSKLRVTLARQGHKEASNFDWKTTSLRFHRLISFVK